MIASAQSTREWVTAVARPNTPLFLSFLISGQDQTAIAANTGLSVGFSNIRRSGIRLQYDRDELAEAAAVVRELSSKEGVGFFERYADRCLDSCHALLETVDGLAGDSPPVNDHKSLEAALAKYFASAIDLGTFLQTLIVVQFELEDTLRQFVTDHLDHPSDDEVREISGALQMATEPTDELRNLTEMLNLGALAQGTVKDYPDWITPDPIALTAHIAHRHHSIWSSLETYRMHFGWMGRRYYSGSPITAIDIVMRLQNLVHDDCQARLASIDRRRHDHLEERDRAIARLGGGDDVRRLADVVSRYMHLRSCRLDVFFIAHERVVPLFEEVARLIPLTGYEDTPYLSWREIMDGIQGNRDGRELADTALLRRAGFEFVSRNGSVEWKSGSSSVGADSPSHTPTDVIRGVSGWGGRLRGQVRVVAGDDDMLQMQQGEVLVATMTQPRLMLAVEKAGAIVTDEGGMLCHAVLVSRERDLPCVIGTELATHVLRTGDLVDVDATAGVVQILNR